jgi:hypothetical protein
MGLTIFIGENLLDVPGGLHAGGGKAQGKLGKMQAHRLRKIIAPAEGIVKSIGSDK